MMVPHPPHLARDSYPVPAGGALGCPVIRSRGNNGLPQTGHRPKSGGASPVSRERSSSIISSVIGGGSVTTGNFSLPLLGCWVLGVGPWGNSPPNTQHPFYHSSKTRGNTHRFA